MRHFVNIFLLSFLFTLSAQAELPVISLAQLRPGAAFTWSYFDLAQNGAPYSTEHYEVLSQVGSFITVLMSTRIDHLKETSFRPTHKFVVDYKKCLDTHSDARQKHNFLIDLYPVQPDGSFVKVPIPTEGLAFEEKFNCHPQERHGFPDSYQTQFTASSTLRGERNLFQQKRVPGDQISGFYFLDDPELKAVLYRKEFNPQSINHFDMRLVDWKPAP